MSELSGGRTVVPTLLPGQPPLAILVDYDGTISQTDVSDVIMADFVTADAVGADWEERVADTTPASSARAG